MSTTVQDTREAQRDRALAQILARAPQVPAERPALALVVGGYPQTRDYDYDGEMEGDADL